MYKTLGIISLILVIIITAPYTNLRQSNRHKERNIVE